MAINKTLTLSGIIKLGDGTRSQIKLIQIDGYEIDLVGRFSEMMSSFPKHMCQINYWISDMPKTKDEILESIFKTLYGVIDAEYGHDICTGSSMTGSWTEEYTTLQIGGHNLYNEISSYEGRFIIMELDFTKDNISI